MGKVPAGILFLRRYIRNTRVSGVSGETQQYQGDSADQASGGAESIRCSADAGPTPDETTYTGSENGQNPSNSASSPDTPDGLDGYREKGQPAPPNGQADPNDLDDAIRAYAVTNPKKSIASIAKYFGQPKAIVAELLGRDR